MRDSRRTVTRSSTIRSKGTNGIVKGPRQSDVCQGKGNSRKERRLYARKNSRDGESTRLVKKSSSGVRGKQAFDEEDGLLALYAVLGEVLTERAPEHS